MKNEVASTTDAIFERKLLVRLGKHLAFLLRHDQEALDQGLIDGNGWRMIDELCERQGYTRELIEEIVKTNEKRRYEYNDDKSKIRARQGHSINVDVELKEEEPPSYLMHGTSEKILETILKEGIKKMSRQYVHLSDDADTAVKVGRRHAHSGKVVVFVISAKAMWYKDGIKFYKSNNGVWLTDYVDPKYIIDYTIKD